MNTTSTHNHGAIRLQTIEAILKSKWTQINAGQQADTTDSTNPKPAVSMKISKESLSSLNEMMRLFVIEALHRSKTVGLTRVRREQRNLDLVLSKAKPGHLPMHTADRLELNIDDLEIVLPQLLLDFS